MRVNIKRYLNSKVWFEDFEVDFKEDETVLELLDRIKNIDSSVTFRAFCRSAICGTCAVKVNDKTVLACKTKVKDVLINNEIIIEPVDRAKVIKDLVVDHSYLEKAHKKHKLWFEGENNDLSRENLQTPAQHKMYEKQTDCILCMACYFECESLDYPNEFAGPFVFSKFFRFEFDSRDKKERINEAKDAGLLNCINCQKCIMVCPKGLKSAFDIKALEAKIPSDFGNFSEGNYFF